MTFIYLLLAFLAGTTPQGADQADAGLDASGLYARIDRIVTQVPADQLQWQAPAGNEQHYPLLIAEFELEEEEVNEHKETVDAAALLTMSPRVSPHATPRPSTELFRRHALLAPGTPLNILYQVFLI